MIIIYFEIKIAKILSENEYLKPKKNKYGGLYIFKLPEVKKYQEDIIYQIYNQIFKFKKEINLLDKKKIKVGIKNQYCFSFKFNSRDIGNMGKIYEDALSQAIEINDNRFFNIYSKKIYWENKLFEKILTDIYLYY